MVFLHGDPFVVVGVETGSLCDAPTDTDNDMEDEFVDVDGDDDMMVKFSDGTVDVSEHIRVSVYVLTQIYDMMFESIQKYILST